MTMMKNLHLIILLFICLSCIGQAVDNTIKKDPTNIYNQAFIKYLQHEEKEYSIVPDTIFVERDAKLTDSLMTKMGETQILIIDSSAILERFLKEKGGITLYRLYPIQYKNREFCVPIVPFGVSFDDDRINCVYLGRTISYWVIFSFRNKKFKFKKIDSYSI
jgi:hypothetical protein